MLYCQYAHSTILLSACASFNVSQMFVFFFELGQVSCLQHRSFNIVDQSIVHTDNSKIHEASIFVEVQNGIECIHIHPLDDRVNTILKIYSLRLIL